MSILVNRDTRVICQGITGKVGEFHTRGCLDYGTRMVGGVTPGRGGEKVADLPVFDTVAEAVAATGANATMIFVPPAFAADAILEAVGAEIPLVIAITEGIPVIDMARVMPVVRASKSRLIGPNCAGVITVAAEKEAEALAGAAEEEAAEFVKHHVTKPVAAFIAGQTAPPGKRMGHAGAIISGGKGTAEAKLAALKDAGIEVAASPADMGAAMVRAIEHKHKNKKK